jgi:tetratricopeptide (TPR) repeat protein
MPNVNEKTSAKVSPIEGINEFVQKNRKIIFISLAVVFADLLAFIVSVSIIDAVRNKAIAAVEELNRRYEVLRFDITTPEKEADVELLLSDMTAFAQKTKGYSGGRAWSIIANINADKKNWAEAEKAWTASAAASKKTYLAPVSYFNAAAAAEEQGNAARAIELYTLSLSEKDDFPAAAHAQFSIGRLQETLGDTAAALDAYRGVVSGWPKDSVWKNLAQSRIIILDRNAAEN